jgi:hypothetical protein
MIAAEGELIYLSFRMLGKCKFIFKIIEETVYMPEDPRNRVNKILYYNN